MIGPGGEIEGDQEGILPLNPLQAGEDERGGNRISWKKIALAGAIYGLSSSAIMMGVHTIDQYLYGHISAITAESFNYILTKTLEHPFTWAIVASSTLLGGIHSLAMQEKTNGKIWF